MINVLSKDEMETVLAHELANVKNKDNRYLPFFHVLSMLSFFDPLTRYLKRRLLKRHEFVADEIAAMTTGKPLSLACALLKLLLLHRGEKSRIASLFGSNSRPMILERIWRLIHLSEFFPKETAE